MKKMQCEVCGSTEIKKVSDGIFECQSCGIQYSTEEAKKLLVEIGGKVKIDHSEEVENSLKRADQFKQKGDSKTAQEYYEKALDLDADNQTAQEEVKKLEEDRKLESYYIIEPNIDPGENVKAFLGQLSSIDNIACDIYKEIEIKSVQERYQLFSFAKRKERIQWSAIACHRYYENETVYETQWNTQKKKNEQVPVTKKVEKVDRVPQSGTHIEEAEIFSFASSAAEDSVQGKTGTVKKQVFAELETLQDSKYGSYTVKTLDSNKTKKESGKVFYCGLELDFSTSQRKLDEQKEKIRQRIITEGKQSIEASMSGDWVENYTANCETLSASTAFVFVPIQIIEYSYMGKDYVAASDLITHTTTVPMSYPCDGEMADEMEKLENLNEKRNKNGLFVVGLCALGVSLIFLILGMLFAPEFFIPIMLLTDIIGLLLMAVGGIVAKSRNKKFSNHASWVKEKLFDPRVDLLEEEKEIFFKEYSDYASAKAAASSTQNFSIKEIYTELHVPSVPRKKMQFITNEVKADDTIAILTREIARLKKQKTQNVLVLFILGTILAVPGILWLIMGYTFWYYSLFFLALTMAVGGVGLALLGSIITAKRKNKKITDLQCCLLWHKDRKAAEENGEEDNIKVEDWGANSRNSRKRTFKWDADYVAETVSKIQANEKTLQETKEQKVITRFLKSLKKQKLAWILPLGIATLFLIATITEIIAIPLIAAPYEEALVGKTYEEVIENDLAEGWHTYYYFPELGKYQWHATWRSKGENKNETMSKEGRYRIRFELFTGKVYLVDIDRNYAELEALYFSSEYEISCFEKFGDEYRLKNDNSLSTKPEDSSSNENSNTKTGTGSKPRAYLGTTDLFNYSVSSKGTVTISTLLNGVNPSHITIPEKIDGYIVTNIGNEAFRYCESLTSVILPDSVTSIGNLAFWDCRSLTSITLPDGLTSIGNSAFGSCYSLTSIMIPNSVTNIGSWAFYLCNNLTIHAPAGSYAEQYAKDNNIHFVAT